MPSIREMLAAIKRDPGGIAKEGLQQSVARPLGAVDQGLDRWQQLLKSGLGSEFVQGLPAPTQLGLRAAAVPFGAGRGQLEEFGQTPEGARGLEEARGFFAKEPQMRGLDYVLGNEPGTFGTAAAMGLAQEGPIGLATGPIGKASAAMKASAPLAREVAGRGGRAIANRVMRAAAREGGVAMPVGAGMGALGAEKGERGTGALMGGAIGLAGGALAGGLGQGAEELARRGVFSEFQSAMRDAEKIPGWGSTDPGALRAMDPDAAYAAEVRNSRAARDLVDFWDKIGVPEGPPVRGLQSAEDAADFMAAKQVRGMGDPLPPEYSTPARLQAADWWEKWRGAADVNEALDDAIPASPRAAERVRKRNEMLAALRRREEMQQNALHPLGEPE